MLTHEDFEDVPEDYVILSIEILPNGKRSNLGV